MLDKDRAARLLAAAHVACEPWIVTVVRVLADREDADDEPVKLLEVNPHTVPAGIVPIAFGPSDDVPWPSVLIEVTPDEWPHVRDGRLPLPSGWRLGSVLHAGQEASGDAVAW